MDEDGVKVTHARLSMLRSPRMRNLGVGLAVLALLAAIILLTRASEGTEDSGSVGYPEPGVAASPDLPGVVYDRGGWWPGSSGDGSMVASTSTLSLSVEDAEGKLDVASELVEVAGGFIVSSSLERADRASAPNARLSARVPADEIDSVIVQMSSLGVVLSRSTFASDVSGAVSDLKMQLDLLRTEEMELLALLEPPLARPSELIGLVERLFAVRSQIGRIAAEMESTSGRVELALLEVSLYGSEVPLSDGGAWSVMSEFRSALAALSDLARTVVSFSVQLIVFGVPLALAAIPVRMFLRRRRSKEQTEQ